MSNEYNALLRFLPLVWQHHEVLKRYHWTTSSHGHHLVVDTYLSQYGPLFDELYEIAQGLYGDIPKHLPEMAHDGPVLDEHTVVPYLQYFADILQSLPLENRALQTVQDQWAGLVDKLIYLLRKY